MEGTIDTRKHDGWFTFQAGSGRSSDVKKMASLKHIIVIEPIRETDRWLQQNTPLNGVQSLQKTCRVTVRSIPRSRNFAQASSPVAIRDLKPDA